MSSLSDRRRQLQREIKAAQKRLCANGKALEKAIQDWAELEREDGLLAFLAALGNCYSRLVQRTPVDTGRARAGWHIEAQVNEWRPEEGEHAGAKGTASAVIAREISKLPSLTRADVVYVMSNIEYILPLEAGYSRQSSGFWALFMEELKRQLEQAAAAAQ